MTFFAFARKWDGRGESGSTAGVSALARSDSRPDSAIAPNPPAARCNICRLDGKYMVRFQTRLFNEYKLVRARDRSNISGPRRHLLPVGRHFRRFKLFAIGR